MRCLKRGIGGRCVPSKCGVFKKADLSALPETGRQVMSQTKKFEITPKMTVLDIVSKYRETEVVFKQYDEPAGECVCCNALFDTLEVVADKYSLDIVKMINDLDNVISSGE